MKIWFLAARPKTLATSFFPALLGVLLAFREGDFNPLLASVTLACALSLQILSNLANDYFDFAKGTDTTERLGPKRVTASGLVTPSQIKQAILLNIFFSLLMGAYLIRVGGFPILLIGVLSILFAIAYTAGPYPLSYLGLGDIFAFIFFGPVAAFGSYYLQTQNFSSEPWIVGSLYGFLSVCLLNANNLRDIEEDTRNHKKTIVVRFGEDFAKKVYATSLTLSLALIPILCAFSILPWISLIVLVLAPLAFKNIQFCKKHRTKELILLLVKTAQFTILYGVLFSLSLWI